MSQVIRSKIRVETDGQTKAIANAVDKNTQSADQPPTARALRTGDIIAMTPTYKDCRFRKVHISEKIWKKMEG